MEKIYEEQIGGQKSPRGQLNISIVLSFVVAAFAIVSLIAVGFNQISFAAPPAQDVTVFNAYIPMDGNYGVTAKVSSESGEFFRVPFYQADSSSNTIPLFCLEHNKTFDANSDQEYNRGDQIYDLGLTYIFNQSGTLGGRGIVPNIGYSESQHDYVERYATQIAIWVYLRDIHSGDSAYSLAIENNFTDSESYDIIRQATYLERTDDTSADPIPLITEEGTYFFDKYILPVINAAKQSPFLKSVSINGDSTISKVGDDDFYQTEELSISCTDNSCVSYKVRVSGIDGAFVVDKDYNTVEDGTSLAGDASFYVRIPVQSVSETARTIQIDVDAVVNDYLVGAEYYATNNTDLQHVVAIIGDQGVFPAQKEIPVVGSPDTGMNKAQTIYFIGLIVLLCGVGIIYANAKPVETE